MFLFVAMRFELEFKLTSGPLAVIISRGGNHGFRLCQD